MVSWTFIFSWEQKKVQTYTVTWKDISYVRINRFDVICMFVAQFLRHNMHLAGSGIGTFGKTNIYHH